VSFLSALRRVFELRHKQSKRAIKDASVIVTNTNGVTESVDKGWRFTPASEVEKVTVAVVGPYETPPVPVAPPRPSIEEFNKPVPVFGADVQEVNKTTYFFGIDTITSTYNIFNNTCGFIFKGVAIGRCSFIELAADAVVNEDCSVEFSIIDGTKEVPILPVTVDRVVNEKFFFNMAPRFEVDTKKAIEIKKNGQIVKRSLDGLEDLNLQDGLYTISYTPMNAYRYSPDNEMINVKVIQRLYSDNTEPSYMTNLLVRKYGGGIPWTA
jgi:hypothetical protein